MIETTSPLLQAAIELGAEARRRGQEPIFPAPARPSRFAADASPYLLIEATAGDTFVTVPMPGGELWKFTLADAPAPGRTVFMLIPAADPTRAQAFRPTAEGIHPHLGEARRFGVERGADQ